MATIGSRPSVDEIADALRENTGELAWDAKEARLFIQILRHLTEGQPVSTKHLEQVASDLGLSEQDAHSALSWISERNEAGDIVGLAGLSLNDWTHRFKVDGRTLSTWCAADTLYLPQLLKRTATVESPDPQTKDLIRLTIGPEKIEQYTPITAVISLIVPRTTLNERERASAEQIWNAFCNYSHYFSSAESAQEWFSTRKVEPIILSVEEGYQLMGIWLRNTIKYA